MKHQHILALTFLVLMGCQAPSVESSPDRSKTEQMHTTTDEAAIKDLLFKYRDALNASSVDQVLPLYTTDGVFMPTGFPTAVGTEQVKGAYAGVFSMIKLNIEFFIDEIEVDGDHAFARTTSRGTTLIHATGENVPEENRELFVLERENGVWKIARYMFNKMKDRDPLPGQADDELAKGKAMEKILRK
ncbi:MAG: SgcJ/EcaC family oxidoreductase [Flavobacteriales bacterium]|nr:SgcJ/EcaC family oxidoreductase [Flavobacteriales bacterium]